MSLLMQQENSHHLKERLEKLHGWQRSVLEHFLARKPVIRDPNAAFDEGLTRGQRIADQIARYGGSWTFIFAFMAVLWVWMIYNVETGKAFDPYPFILLNLVLSCLAAIQAPVIMMSQNRQTARDRMDAQHDYEVNMKTELEVLALHTKLDDLREQRLQDIVEALQHQNEILERIEAHLHENPSGRGGPKAPPVA
jgi:uncharacterized membrane protein